MTLSETCSSGVASCYWRVRAVNVRGGAGPWRSVDARPWAPIVSLVPAAGPNQVMILFSGPAESGPDGAPKYYSAFICKTSCNNASSWADSGLSIPYPPSGAAPHPAGTFTCEDGLVCQVRMQLTDGRGDHGILSEAAIVLGSGGRVLNVNIVGSGRVVSSPGGVDCAISCAAAFPDGSLVGLVATPVPGGTFVGWSGDCSGADGCILTMNQDHSVTATFTLYPNAGTPPAIAGTEHP